MLVAVSIAPYRTLHASSLNIRLAAQPSQMDGAAIKGPVEEVGRRGVALPLPLLQRKLPPIGAGLILGVIWGLRHFSAFLLSGTPQSVWSFTLFCWFDCRQRDRDAIIQRIAWQRPAPCIV